MPVPLRPTHLIINLSQLKRNIEAIRAQVTPAKVMVMLKANAYGHGLEAVARYIEPYLDYIGVAILDEAIFLREIGIKKPILVIGAAMAEHIPYYLEYGLTLTAASPEILAAAEIISAKKGQRLKVHLKIDTGMERVGVRFADAEPFVLQAAQAKHLDVEGIYTHFANSDNPDLTHARLQLARFNQVLALYEKHHLALPALRHTANSGAVLHLPESYMDMVRPGILFYGVHPNNEVNPPVKVEPALVWKSQVSFLKEVPAGYPVSYGSLWQSEQDSRIATIQCGYGDGYFRAMTNQAQVLINGERHPQVGRICMDQFMVNMEGQPATLGDEVILLGQSAQNGQRIRTEELAQWANTNVDEVLTNISARVPRTYIED